MPIMFLEVLPKATSFPDTQIEPWAIFMLTNQVAVWQIVTVITYT